MYKYKYKALDIFSGKYVVINSNKYYQNGTLIKGYEIKNRI